MWEAKDRLKRKKKKNVITKLRSALALSAFLTCILTLQSSFSDVQAPSGLA